MPQKVCIQIKQRGHWETVCIWFSVENDNLSILLNVLKKKYKHARIIDYKDSKFYTEE